MTLSHQTTKRSHSFVWHCYWICIISTCGIIACLTLKQSDKKHNKTHLRFAAQSESKTTSSSEDGRQSNVPIYPNAISIYTINLSGKKQFVKQCQAWEPSSVAPQILNGVDSAEGGPQGEAHWDASRPIPWAVFAQGEYVGPYRTPHMPEYRLRVDDVIEFVYRLTREESAKPYELNVGDKIRVESLADEKIDRELVILPDGSISLRLLGQVRAARRTVEQLRTDLEEQYKTYYKVPSITVTPVEVNTKLEDLRATVDVRFGTGGQNRTARVTPEGTIQLPAIGSVPAHGLSLNELKREIDERYSQVVEGIEVTPVLSQRAPRFIYVLGEVVTSGRYTMEAPTTVMQAIALAGGWNNGGNLREIVIFRRTEDWRLIATRLDMRGALLGRRPSPADEIWLRDSDIVVIPKSPMLLADDFIDLFFTRGVFGVVPFQGISLNFSKASTL